MSRQTTKANLLGYDGPADLVEELRQVLEPQSFNGVQLEWACERIRGFKEKEITEITKSPRTEDGYNWFWSCRFEIRLGREVMILIPWAQDWKKTDGSKFDRAIAVYTKGSASIDEVGWILHKLAEALKNVFALASKDVSGQVHA